MSRHTLKSFTSSTPEFFSLSPRSSMLLNLSRFCVLKALFMGPPWKPLSIDIVKDLIGFRL